MTAAQANGGLRLVGRNDLQGRSAYQPVVHAYGNRRAVRRDTTPAKRRIR